MNTMIVEGAAAINLCIIAGSINAHGGWGYIYGKLFPSILAVLLGIQAYGRFMGWPV